MNEYVNELGVGLDVLTSTKSTQTKSSVTIKSDRTVTMFANTAADGSGIGVSDDRTTIPGTMSATGDGCLDAATDMPMPCGPYKRRTPSGVRSD